MHVHLVFVTKYLKKVFTKEVLKDLEKIFSKVCVDFEAELVECDGEILVQKLKFRLSQRLGI